jgi:hypothetical protein
MNEYIIIIATIDPTPDRTAWTGDGKKVEPPPSTYYWIHGDEEQNGLSR